MADAPGGRGWARYDHICNRAYGTARRWLMPGLQNSQWEYRRLLIDALGGTGRWLDLGCGHDFLPEWFTSEQRALDCRRWSTAGVDLDRAALQRHSALHFRIHANVERLPFASASFQLVTANMVLEHVKEPAALFHEVRRVLADEGRFLVHTPNAHGYTTALTRLVPHGMLVPLAQALQSRATHDVYRTYYRANSPARLERLAADAALELDSIRLVQSSPQLIRVPPLMFAEMLLIRGLEAAPLAGLRACIVATFRKAAGPGAAPRAR